VSIRGQDQDLGAGLESAVIRWVMEGGVHNLKRVAIDWGSLILLVRHLVVEAKSGAAF
jgi:hypothetical protein